MKRKSSGGVDWESVLEIQQRDLPQSLSMGIDYLRRTSTPRKSPRDWLQRSPQSSPPGTTPRTTPRQPQASQPKNYHEQKYQSHYQSQNQQPPPLPNISGRSATQVPSRQTTDTKNHNYETRTYANQQPSFTPPADRHQSNAAAMNTIAADTVTIPAMGLDTTTATELQFYLERSLELLRRVQKGQTMPENIKNAVHQIAAFDARTR